MYVNLTLTASIATLVIEAMVPQDTTQELTRKKRFVRHVRTIAQSVADPHAAKVATKMQQDNARYAAVGGPATKHAGICVQDTHGIARATRARPVAQSMRMIVQCLAKGMFGREANVRGA